MDYYSRCWRDSRGSSSSGGGGGSRRSGSSSASELESPCPFQPLPLSIPTGPSSRASSVYSSLTNHPGHLSPQPIRVSAKGKVPETAGYLMQPAMRASYGTSQGQRSNLSSSPSYTGRGDGGGGGGAGAALPWGFSPRQGQHVHLAKAGEASGTKPGDTPMYGMSPASAISSGPSRSIGGPGSLGGSKRYYYGAADDDGGSFYDGYSSSCHGDEPSNHSF